MFFLKDQLILIVSIFVWKNFCKYISWLGQINLQEKHFEILLEVFECHKLLVHKRVLK